MKRSLLAAALFASTMSLALASPPGNNGGGNGGCGQGQQTNGCGGATVPGGGVAGGIVVIGGAAGFIGNVSGTASSVSDGSAVAVGTVPGSGYSFQSSVANSGGTATIGGAVTGHDATVATNTTQFANVANVGLTNQAVYNGEGLIQNGAIASGQSVNKAKGTAAFDTAAIGGIAGIAGVAGVAGF